MDQKSRNRYDLCRLPAGELIEKAKLRSCFDAAPAPGALEHEVFVILSPTAWEDRRSRRLALCRESFISRARLAILLAEEDAEHHDVPKDAVEPLAYAHQREGSDSSLPSRSLSFTAEEASTVTHGTLVSRQKNDARQQDGSMRQRSPPTRLFASEPNRAGPTRPFASVPQSLSTARSATQERSPSPGRAAPEKRHPRRDCAGTPHSRAHPLVVVGDAMECGGDSPPLSTVCASRLDSRVARRQIDAGLVYEQLQLQACQQYLSTMSHTIPDRSGGAGWRRGNKYVQAQDMAAWQGKAHEHSSVPCNGNGVKTEQARDFLLKWGILADGPPPVLRLEMGQEDFNVASRREEAAAHTLLEQYSRTLA